MQRGEGPGAGFAVELEQFELAGGELAEIVEGEERRRRREHDPQGVPPPAGCGAAGLGGRPAPPWLGQANTDWCARRDQLLIDLTDTATALRDTARSYLRGDEQLAAVIISVGRGEHVIAPGHDNGGVPVVPAAVQADPNPPPPDYDAMPPVPVYLAPTVTASAAMPAGMSLDRALVLWQARSDAALQTSFLLSVTAVTVPAWRGAAADNYGQWLADHRDRWAALHADATRIHHALTDHDAPAAARPRGAPPVIVTDVDITIHTAAPDPPAPEAADRATPAPPPPPASLHGPAQEGQPPPPPPPPPLSPPPATIEPGHQPGHRRPGHEEHAPVPFAPEPLPGGNPDPVPMPPPTATGLPAGAGVGASSAHSLDGHAVLIGATATAAAAAAAAMVLARRDRARQSAPADLTAATSPRSAGATSSTGAPAADPITSPRQAAGEGTDRDPTPPGASAQRPFPAPSAPAPRPIPPTSSSQHRNGAREGTRPRRSLHIGVHDGQPVLLDLAATGGFGLTGPGAPAIARTLVRLLTDHAPPATIVLPVSTAAALLQTPTDDEPTDLPAGGSEPSGSGVLGNVVRTVPDPFLALQATETELARRRAHPNPAARPWLLIVPAPATTAAQHRLRAALTAGRDHDLVAVITGWWPPGWSCHVDDQHRITRHTPPHPTPGGIAASLPAHLTGAHLFPTPTATLRHTLEHHDATAAAPSNQQPPPPTDDAAEPAPAARPAPLAPRPAGPPGPSEGHAAATADDHGPDTPRPLSLSILGPTVLCHSGADHSRGAESINDQQPSRPISGLGPRATELLVYLAVHPAGVHRDQVVTTLWPDASPDRPTNALHATLARLRRTLRSTGDPGLAQLVTQHGDRYRLHPDLVAVDYWTFLVAAAELAQPDPDLRVHACETVIDAYQGPLAVDHTGEWLITLREATRRRYLEALTTLARLTISRDPERTLGLLETARNLEPLNEAIYRDIMRIQAQLDRPDDAANTYALLHAQLADIEAEPEPATIQLAEAIHQRANHREPVNK